MATFQALDSDVYNPSWGVNVTYSVSAPTITETCNTTNNHLISGASLSGNNISSVCAGGGGYGLRLSGNNNNVFIYGGSATVTITGNYNTVYIEGGGATAISTGNFNTIILVGGGVEARVTGNNNIINVGGGGPYVTASGTNNTINTINATEGANSLSYSIIGPVASGSGNITYGL